MMRTFLLTIVVGGLGTATLAGCTPPPTLTPAVPTSADAVDTRSAGMDLSVLGAWSTGQTVSLTLSVVTDDVSTVDQITVTASDGVFARVDGTPVSHGLSDDSARWDVAVTARVKSTVHGTIEGAARVTSPHGGATVVQRSLWVADESGAVLSSLAGPDAVDLAVAERRRPTQTAEQYRQSVDAVRYDDAAVTTEVSGSPAGPRFAVAGTVGYLDSANRTHAVRGAQVVLVDSDGATDTLTTTDAHGEFRTSVDAARAADCAACRVRVLTVYGNQRVVDERGGMPYGIETDPLDLRRSAGLTVGLVANNVADNNTAFDVGDALGVVRDGVVRSRPALDTAIDVAFPTARLTSSFDAAGDGRLHLLRNDRFDGDVIGHEFGHVVAYRLGISSGVDGPHSAGSGSADRLGVQDGEALAWSEGFATYVSLAAQQAAGAASLDIPNLGDATYTDTEDTDPPLQYAADRVDATTAVGPDDELTVLRTLWGSHLGLTAALDIAANRHATSLADLLSALSAGACGPIRTGDAVATTECGRVDEMSCAAARNGSGIVDLRRTGTGFTWRSAAASAAERLDRFEAVVLSPTGTTVADSAMLDRASWSVDLEQLPPAGRLMVFGWTSGTPASGPWSSCATPLP